MLGTLPGPRQATGLFLQGGGPLHCRCWSSVSLAVCLWQTGDYVPVLRHVALQCFADCPRYVLDRLAELEGVPHERTATELQSIHRMLRVGLPDLPSQSTMHMLLIRLFFGEHKAHLMSTLPEEAIEDLLPTSEIKDVKA